MTTRGNRLFLPGMMRAALCGCLLAPFTARAATWQDDRGLLYAHLEHLHWVASGHGPKVLYDFVDPNARSSHTLVLELTPLVARDHLTVRTLLVGYLTKTSAGKAAAILQAADPPAALARTEAAFTRTQGGAIAPALILPAARQILQADFRALSVLEGNPWMRMAPLLVYRGRRGRVHVFQGALTPARLTRIIRAAGP